MHVCAVSFKQCWQDEAGNWFSSGGFPLQMRAIGSLFDEMTILIVRGQPREGGLPLPSSARVMPLHCPTGSDTRRKFSVLAHLPQYLPTIARHIRRADVVHTPLPGDIPLLGMIVAMLFRKRLIARYGGSWSTTSQTTLMNRVTRMWLRAFAGRRNVVLATGEGEIPPAEGIDWIFATALSRSELDAISPEFERGLSSPPRIVYAGRLSEEKGVGNLVRAVVLLRKEGFTPLPRVTIVGDGPERQSLENLVRDLNCEDLIAFAGQLNRESLSKVLSQSDFCVQPSLTEGFSKAWLDAMAHGLPVLASEVGAARAVIGPDTQRGWLVPPGDVSTLAERLRQVLTGPIDWPALRLRCRTYLEGHTLEAWAEKIGQNCARQWNISFLRGKLCQ